MQHLYVIDAAGYLYSSYFAIRQMTNAKGESTNALFGFIRSLLKLLRDFHPEHVVAVFDGPNNIGPRKSLYADYKAHRAKMPGDLLYQMAWAKQFCDMMGIPHLEIPNVEADDTMGTLAVWGEKERFDVFLCTSDKDLCQFVSEKVRMLNTRKENQLMGPQEVEDAWGVPPHQMRDLLAIVGDSSDNIPGLSGFGPKTAAALLKTFGTLENLLAHPESLPAKKQEILQNEKDKVLLSQKLVTIDTHVPIPHEASFFRLRQPDLSALKTFYGEMNFHTLIKELEAGSSSLTPSSEEQLTFLELEATEAYQLVDTPEDLQALVDELKKHSVVCFDTETTDIHPLRAELVGIGFCVEAKKAWYVPTNGKLGLKTVVEALRPVFEEGDRGFFGHNVKYDYHVLKRHGIQVKQLCFDTILASYILNAHLRQHSLDYLSLEIFGKVKISIDQLIGKGKNLISMRQVPIEKVCRYCCEDVDYTFRLKEVLEKQLIERNLTSVLMDLELPLTLVLAKMEGKGIYIDVPYLEKMSIEVAKHIKHFEEEIFQLAGETFNLNSPKQLGEILFQKMGIKPPKKTATGGLSTNAEVLENLSSDFPIAGKILEYRTLEKLRSTYLEALPQEVDPRTHRIHCNFNQSVAATGRLSSQDPNLQNIPVRSEWGRKIRVAFKPQKEGWVYLAADYSQIELRLLAHLSEDPDLIAAFMHNEDIHRHTAANIFGVPLSEVTSEQRHQAKAVNFGVIYGQQAFGLAQELGIDMKRAAAFIELYFQRFKRVKQYMEECKESARRTGYTKTLTGRQRAVPEILSKNAMIRQAAERLAINTPLQGTAADLIKWAMLKVDKRLTEKSFESFMILQIHDELLFEVKENELKEMESLVREAMENVWQLKVPLIVDISIGKNWEEC